MDVKLDHQIEMVCPAGCLVHISLEVSDELQTISW